MLWNLPHPALLAIALFIYLMVLCCLKVLALRYHNHIALHDRVRESHQLRAEYQRILDEQGQK